MFLMPSAEIELSFKQYPVDVPILSGTGAENEIALWNGIVGYEIFPATESPDSYRLTLKKSANVVEDVWRIDKELENALVDLSHVGSLQVELLSFFMKRYGKRTFTM